jgi:hypothetical protein
MDEPIVHFEFSNFESPVQDSSVLNSSLFLNS